MAKNRKEEAKRIIITIDNWSDARANEIVLTVKDRRELNQLLFKDTQGRTRVGMEGEPLLTNMEGPAISYPDGEEEFYIHGHQADITQLPGLGDYAEHDATGIVWDEIGGYKISMPMGICSAVCSCGERDGEDTHGWELTLRLGEDDELEVVVDIDFEDMDEYSFILDNDLDMNPLAVFHTMELGHRLLMEFSHRIPQNGAYAFLLPEAEERILKQIQDQIDGYVAAKNAESKTESGSGLGGMVVAGLAAAAAVSAVGALTKSNKRAKQVREKVEASA